MTEVVKDRWLTVALLATAVLYFVLLLLRPSGEGWGRGWNMVAFVIYSVPTSIVAGAVALWRVGKVSGQARRVAVWLTAAAFIFPIVCILVVRMKA
ncbi:hypothetical protein [Quatrionicoccus australiensis]|uniref:hypothetical protein n=1 Tax=Quatrionicoccus australiensis TaxID=138118 RepID=UPI001CFA322F|nr:hypothetical protein [Quatrionicoccus australiensis]MCB4358883.1 hypothetical protein [Quatrionicoccus australiensis]